MIKIMFIIFIGVLIFTTGIYSGIFEGIKNVLLTAQADLIPYLPIEIKIPIFILILAIFYKMASSLLKI